MKIVYQIIAISLLFISCEKEIELTQEETAPRVVVNSIFTTDSSFHVNLSESRSLLSNEELPYLENATIRLLDENGTVLGTFIYETFGNYRLTSEIATSNTRYSIEVSAPGFETVTAASNTPDLIDIISVDTSFNTNHYSMNFDIQFQDQKNIKNYYIVKVLTGSFWIDYETEDTLYYEYEGMSTAEPYVVNGYSDFADNRKFANQFYFSDELFDGNLINFSAEASYIDPVLGGFYRVLVMNLSEEAYKYFVSLDRYYQADNDFFAEPVQIISNVENGYGIFAGQTSDQEILVVE